MNNTSVIILAAGDAVRFGGIRKQLLPIGATSILKRMVDQAKHNCCCPTVVAADDEIISAALSYGAQAYLPVNKNATCDTLLSSWELWSDRVVVLLGDVVYSNDTINKIFSYDGQFSAFGDTWELFALSFTRPSFSGVCASLNKAKVYKFGKLRYMYKNYIGIPMDSKEIEGSPPGSKFVYIRDWTMDVDMQDEYNNLMREVVERGLLDV